MCTKATRNELSYCVDPFIYPRHAILHNIREHIFCLIPSSNDREIYQIPHSELRAGKRCKASCRKAEVVKDCRQMGKWMGSCGGIPIGRYDDIWSGVHSKRLITFVCSLSTV